MLTMINSEIFQGDKIGQNHEFNGQTFFFQKPELNSQTFFLGKRDDPCDPPPGSATVRCWAKQYLWVETHYTFGCENNWLEGPIKNSFPDRTMATQLFEVAERH